MSFIKTKQNIPQGWQEKKLIDVCDIVNGSTPKRSVPEYWENGNIPWFTVDDIRSNGRIIDKTNQSITSKALKETSVKLLPEDSVLLCCTASLGEVAIAKIPLTTNQQFNGLVAKDKKNLFPDYLFYFAQKLGENLKSKSGKTTINFLSVGTLSKEKVLLPPISEQQKIAEILGAVDEDIDKTQGVIEATEKLKRGLMQQLFTRGIGHTKFKETKIGEIPDGWRVGTLDEITEKISVGFVGTCEPFYTDESGVPMLRTGNLKEWGIDISDLKYVTKEFHIKNKKSQINSGDILIARHGENGLACLVPEGFPESNCLNVVIIRPNSETLDSKYLFYAINSPLARGQIEAKTGGSTQKVVNTSDIKLVLIGLPEKPEQQKIAGILSAVDEKISVNKKLKEKLILLKNGLMQDLLSGKVRTKTI